MKYDQTNIPNKEHRDSLWWVLAKLAIWGGLLVIFATAFQYGLNEQAKGDCTKWSKQAESNPSFYVTGWQAEMCRELKVELNATVRQ